MLKLINEIEVEENVIINKIYGNSLEVNDALKWFILEAIANGLLTTMKNWDLDKKNPIIIELMKNGFIYNAKKGLQINSLHTVVNHSQTFFGIPNGDLNQDCSANEKLGDIYGFITVPYNRGSLVYNIDIDSANYIRNKSNDLLQITVQEGKTEGYYSTLQKKKFSKVNILKIMGKLHN